MGYFHGWSNFAECGYMAKCVHCGQEMSVFSPRQKTCHRSENPSCDDDIILLVEVAKGKSMLLRDLSIEDKLAIVEKAEKELSELIEKKKEKLRFYMNRFHNN